MIFFRNSEKLSSSDTSLHLVTQLRWARRGSSIHNPSPPYLWCALSADITMHLLRLPVTSQVAPRITGTPHGDNWGLLVTACGLEWGWGVVLVSVGAFMGGLSGTGRAGVDQGGM